MGIERAGTVAEQLRFIGEGDPLRRMAAYRLSIDLLDSAWLDTQVIRKHTTTSPLARSCIELPDRLEQISRRATAEAPAAIGFASSSTLWAQRENAATGITRRDTCSRPMDARLKRLS
jgi:hypothetical protein